MSMIDANLAVLFLKQSFEDVGKVFGPSYIKLLVDYAKQFEAEKLGESPPAEIQTIDDVVNYILKNLDRYPRGYCALVFGNAKADSKIEGATGAAWKRSGLNALKQLMQASGLLGETLELKEALEKSQEFAKSINMAAQLQFINESEDTVSVVVEKCPFTDSCEAFDREGISRVAGRRECANLICYTAAAQLVTGKQCDYSLVRNEGKCLGKIFLV